MKHSIQKHRNKVSTGQRQINSKSKIIKYEIIGTTYSIYKMILKIKQSLYEFAKP